MALNTSVSEQSIAALLNMGGQLEELTVRIHQETLNLKSAFEQNMEGLGPHVSSIQTLIDDVEGTEQDATKPVKILVLKLQRAAVVRQGILQKNRYQNSNSYSKGRSR